MNPEKFTQPTPEFNFIPEGYVGPSDPEYLEQFLDFLKQQGIESSDVVFSGFDGINAAVGEEIPRYTHVNVMNEGGWREAIEAKVWTPAKYAEGGHTPCIAVYDKHLLTSIYSYTSESDGAVDANDLESVVAGDRLTDLSPDVPVCGEVIHINYPEGSPTDAIVALVFTNR